MSGSLRQYELRGLIPRSLTFLFSQLERTTDATFSVSVSFCEIYLEFIYDLLAEGGLEGQTGTELQVNLKP